MHFEAELLCNNMLDLIFQSCDIIILLSCKFDVDPKLIEYDLKSLQYELMDNKGMFINDDNFWGPVCHSKFMEHKFVVDYLEKMLNIHFTLLLHH